MSITTDPKHPALMHGVDEKPVEQAKVYLVLSDAERAKGFVRPFRDEYQHTVCGVVTSMGHDLSATYARDPKFYVSTYCIGCRMHKPVSEFRWTLDGETMGS